MPGIKYDSKGFLKVLGDKQLQKNIQKLQENMQRRILRPAINFGLTPVTRAAKANAPKETGILKKAIKKKVGKRGAWGKVYIDPKAVTEKDGKIRRPAKYAHLMEFGTKDIAPRPFLRPARDSKKPEVIARIAAKAREKLAKLANK